MEFIAENYIWFIIIGIVVLMTIIGYIADKTNFTKKEENREKIKGSKKKKKEKIEEVEAYEEIPEENVPTQNNDILEEILVEDIPANEVPEINAMEDFNMDSTKPEFEMGVPEVLGEEVLLENEETEPLFREEDTVQNLDEIVASKPTEVSENESQIEEDLYVGLDGTPNAYKEVENTDEQDDLEIELPSISSLDSELKEETDEDDVWKF